MNRSTLATAKATATNWWLLRVFGWEKTQQRQGILVIFCGVDFKNSMTGYRASTWLGIDWATVSADRRGCNWSVISLLRDIFIVILENCFLLLNMSGVNPTDWYLMYLVWLLPMVSKNCKACTVNVTLTEWWLKEVAFKSYNIAGFILICSVSSLWFFKRRVGIIALNQMKVLREPCGTWLFSSLIHQTEQSWIWHLFEQNQSFRSNRSLISGVSQETGTF